MAGVSAEEFAATVELVCAKSKIVVRVAPLSKSAHQAKMRIYLKDRSIVSAYYNDQNGKTGFAHLRANERIFGADNSTENWHWHPYEDPSLHVASADAITFEEFLSKVEQALK